MCLTIPGKVLEVHENKKAVISYGKKTIIANCELVSCKPGDYVIVSNGFVMRVVDKNQAIMALNALKNVKI